jgi:ketosteroid isomerase-like protein
MSNVEIVNHLYDRFAHGDGAAILAAFDPQVEFRLAEGHPYSPEGESWIGGDAVAKNFFMKSAGQWEGWSMGIDRIVESGDTVVVEGRYSGTYKPTGLALDTQVCHIWRFSGGLVKSFHQYVNTAHLQEIMDKAREKEQLAS